MASRTISQGVRDYFTRTGRTKQLRGKKNWWDKYYGAGRSAPDTTVGAGGAAAGGGAVVAAAMEPELTEGQQAYQLLVGFAGKKDKITGEYKHPELRNIVQSAGRTIKSGGQAAGTRHNKFPSISPEQAQLYISDAKKRRANNLRADPEDITKDRESVESGPEGQGQGSIASKVRRTGKGQSQSFTDDDHDKVYASMKSLVDNGLLTVDKNGNYKRTTKGMNDSMSGELKKLSRQNGRILRKARRSGWTVSNARVSSDDYHNLDQIDGNELARWKKKFPDIAREISAARSRVTIHSGSHGSNTSAEIARHDLSGHERKLRDAINAKRTKDRKRASKAAKTKAKNKEKLEDMNDGGNQKPVDEFGGFSPNLTFLFDKKQNRRKNYTLTGAGIGTLAATLRHRDALLGRDIEAAKGRKIKKSTKTRFRLRLYGGAAGRIAGGAGLGYLLARALEKKKND